MEKQAVGRKRSWAECKENAKLKLWNVGSFGALAFRGRKAPLIWGSLCFTSEGMSCLFSHLSDCKNIDLQKCFWLAKKQAAAFSRSWLRQLILAFRLLVVWHGRRTAGWTRPLVPALGQPAGAPQTHHEHWRSRGHLQKLGLPGVVRPDCNAINSPKYSTWPKHHCHAWSQNWRCCRMPQSSSALGNVEELRLESTTCWLLPQRHGCPSCHLKSSNPPVSTCSESWLYHCV